MTDVSPVPRARPIQRGSERAMLESMLDFYRATVVNKVAGLSDEQAFTALVPPSTLTPRRRGIADISICCVRPRTVPSACDEPVLVGRSGALRGVSFGSSSGVTGGR
jgi:hypothetical protein